MYITANSENGTQFSYPLRKCTLIESANFENGT